MPLLGGFTFSAPVQVLAVISATGPTTGGATVLIIGAEFRYGANVDIGGLPATAVVVVDGNHIRCVTPAHAVGAVDVHVNNPSGLFVGATLTNGYTYFVAPPTVLSILGVSGGIAGGESVVITGTGFVAGATVKFGATAVAALFGSGISGNYLTCTTPAHAVGYVDVTVTNPDTQFGTLFSAYLYIDPAVAGVPDDKGWWWSNEGLAGGTQLAVAPGVPKHPRTWAKLATIGTLGLGGSPAASVVYRNHIIYAGDDYVLGSEQPTIRIFDGIADRLMVRIPNNAAGTVTQAIVAMLLVNGTIYLTTYDTGTGGTTASGRVFAFDPLAQTLTPIGAAFTGGFVPYTLAWHMDRLWVGLNTFTGADGTVYYFRPNIDTTWTLDETLVGFGSAASMISYGGQLYVGTSNVAAAFGRVVKRDTAGAWTSVETGVGGTARINNGYYSLIVFLGSLYATFWNNDGTAIAKVRKFDGTTWTTAFTGATLTLRPYMLTFLANKLLYVVGGGVGQRACLIRTADGTTWDNLTAYLAGPITDTALPLYGVVGI